MVAVFRERWLKFVVCQVLATECTYVHPRLIIIHLNLLDVQRS